MAHQLTLDLPALDLPTFAGQAAKLERQDFAQPDGTRPRVPNCGIVACAFAAGVPVAVAHRDIIEAERDNRVHYAAIHRSPSILKALYCGGTWHEERIAYLDRAGVRYEDVPINPCQLKTLVRQLDPERFYMIRVTRHVVTVHDGRVMDQSGIAPIDEHWTQRKRATFCTEIFPK